jgi:hypothetical protein
MDEVFFAAAALLENSVLGITMRKSIWLYPAVQALHITGVVILVGPALMFDIRLLGYTPKIRIGVLAEYLLPWSRVGLAIAVISGVLLFVAHATDWYNHPLFITKMILIGIAGLNILIFHKKIIPGHHRLESDQPVSRNVRMTGILSIVLWIAIIVSGRFLAYF